MNASAMADDYGAMRTSLALGEAAMMLDGAWSTGPTLPMYEIDPDLQMGFFAVPGQNGKVYAFGDGTYQVNANSTKAEIAQTVLDFTATKEFAELCAELGIRQSMGAVGSSADNSAAEAFNATLKRETLQGAKSWPTARAARLAVFKWITRYNTRRRHSTLGYLSPIDYERQTTARVLLAA